MSPQRPELATLWLTNLCPADWEEMEGKDEVRFCPHCQLHVHNLSTMTQPKAETLLHTKQGRLCLGLNCQDGVLLGRDAPPARSRETRKFLRTAKVMTAAAILCYLSFLMVVFLADSDFMSDFRKIKPVNTFLNWLVPPPAPPMGPMAPIVPLPPGGGAW